MHRYENILAGLGGMSLDDAIGHTQYALSRQLGVSGLVISGNYGSVKLTLEEKHTIAKYLREILETRLNVLENESDDKCLNSEGRGVPVYSTRTGSRYVRIQDIPGALQDDFMRYLRGAAVPVVTGEDGPVAYETDWLDWLHRRRPYREPTHRR